MINTWRGKAIAFSMLVLCTGITSVQARAQTTQARAEDQRTLEEWFSDPSNLSTSGCDSATWNIMREAMRAATQRRELPPSTIDDDLARSDQAFQCYQKASDAKLEMEKALASVNRDTKKRIASFGDYNQVDAKIDPFAISLIDSDATKISLFFDEIMTLDTAIDMARQAADMYARNADETKYHNVVERYNALANSLANVRLAQGSSFPI